MINRSVRDRQTNAVSAWGSDVYRLENRLLTKHFGRIQRL